MIYEATSSASKFLLIASLLVVPALGETLAENVEKEDAPYLKKGAVVDYQAKTIRFGGHRAHPFRILARAKSEVRQAGMNLATTAIDAAGMQVEKQYQMVEGLLLLQASEKAGEKGSRAEGLAKRIEALRASGAFDYVEPDWVVHTQLQATDSAFTDGTLWGLRNTGQDGGTANADVNAEAAWDVTTGSDAVVVGVIDSGIRYTHQDLAGNMWTNPGETPGDEIDNDGNGFVDDVHGINAITNSGDPMDDNDHGTHVAGTIGATANDAYPHVGVAWNVQLMGLKFLDAQGFGSTSDAITCIEYAAANGADILNNSWGGGGFSEALRDSIEAANAAGILFVAAAGNAATNTDLTPSYPSSYTVPNVVSVAAHDRNDMLAGFSNYGRHSVDLGAPGVAIYSSVATSDSSYGSFGGTSMASPHVAGVAALIASQHSGISVGELKQRLLATVSPTSALADTTVSGGRVDAYAALIAAPDGDMELTAAPRALPLVEFSNADFFVGVADIAPVTGATVTGRFAGEPAVTFADDGILPDEFAGDGVYSASVTLPAASDPASFSVSASAAGKNSATETFEMTVLGPPPNDDFANRTTINDDMATLTASNIVATGETNEPNHAGVSTPLASAWWSWTASESGPVEINTFGSDFDTTLAVYTGTTLDTLTHVASNDDSGSFQSRVRFQAVTGQTYQIAVDGYSSATGSITLNLVAAGSSVRYLSHVVDDDRNGGSSGNGDGLANPSETVELVVTLENTGSVQENAVNAVLSTSDPYITSITDNTEDYGDIPPGGSAPSEFDYDFTVDPAAPGLRNVEFSLWISSSEGIAVETFHLQLGPSNDAFADGREIPSDARLAAGSNAGFGGESGEPDHAGVSAPLASAWWTWTPSSNMNVIINTVGSDFDTTLAVYQGNSLGSLVEVVGNNDAIGNQSEVTFLAMAGQTYQIAVDGNGTAEGTIALNFLDADTTGYYRLEWSGTPHGNSANAVAIARIDLSQWQNPSQGSGSFLGSGLILHELTVDGASSGNGTFGFSDFDRFFFDTQGTELDYGAELVGQPLSGGGAWATTFDGTSGDFNLFSTGSAPSGTLYFRLTTDGGSGDHMNLVSFAPTAGTGPANDDWENAAPLPDAPFSESGSNIGATTQLNEPDVGTPGATVWWWFEAQGTGEMTLDTIGSDFDTMLHVYEGAENASGVGDLSLVVFNNDASGLQSEVTFDVIGEKWYEVRVSGFSGDTGSIALNGSFVGASGEPVAVLRGSGAVVNPGDDTPSLGDGTDWGAVVEGTTLTRTFTISNEGTGNAPLELTGSPLVSVGGSSDFTIGSQPSNRVENGQSTSFTVVYSPGDVSPDSATVSFSSNDPSQPEYGFAVAGEGAPDAGSITGKVFDDANGNGTDDGENGLAGVTVFLDADYDGNLDAGETGVATASDGSFTFTDVPSGLWQVAVVPPAGGTVTSPGSSGAEVTTSTAKPSLKPAPVPEVKTNGTTAPIYLLGGSTPISPLDVEFNTVVGLDQFRADPRFAGIDGSGWAVAILDSGLHNDNDAFGPDSNGDGVADRIVFQYDYGDNDSDASAVSSAHGTNVASVAAASRADMLGVAPGADIINLKVFADTGSGNFAMTEGALQWVNTNVGSYQIASINMSLGDSENYQTTQLRYGVDDEMAAIAAQDCLVVSASGNSFFDFSSAQGVAYPSADPNSLSIGATFDAFRSGPVTWSSGARADTIDTDRLTPFSQRHATLTTVFAPGAWAFGGGLDGGTSSMTGTSQASPLVAGVGVLAQQLADRELGRRLTQAEFVSLLRSTAVTINDGDDEDDNVTNTGLDFPRVDVFALGEAILGMGRDPAPHTWLVRVEAGATVENVDFGIGIGTAGETWEDWQAGHFSIAELEDPLLTGPDADYDGDGIPNLIEFALGMNPTVGGDGPVHEHAIEVGNHISLTIRIDGSLSGITYEVRASDDLSTWTTIARSVDGGPMQPVGGGSTVSDPGGDVREVTVTDAVSGTANGSKRFVRLRVNQP